MRNYTTCTTPFEREVLTHHYTSGERFSRPSELYEQTVDRFVSLGLLRRNGDRVMGCDSALEVYMDALGSVPFPVEKWVMPSSNGDASR